MPIEWNTSVRDKWDDPIRQIVKAIDNHTRLYLETGDRWHWERAEDLRNYLHKLKNYIHAQEGRG